MNSIIKFYFNMHNTCTTHRIHSGLITKLQDTFIFYHYKEEIVCNVFFSHLLFEFKTMTSNKSEYALNNLAFEVQMLHSMTKIQKSIQEALKT